MKPLLSALIFLFVLSYGAMAQTTTVTAHYLDPGFKSPSNYDYMIFGTSTKGIGGFMYNHTSTNQGFGNGEDFAIHTYGDRDMVLNTAAGKLFFNTTRIGLNTYTPQAKLHIPNGDIIVGGIEGVQNTINASLMVKSRADANDTYPFYVGKYGSGSDLFWVRGDGNSFFRGSLGIGIQNPQIYATEGQLQIDNADPLMVIGGDQRVTSGKSTLRFHAGITSPALYANGFDIVYRKDATTDRLSFVDGGPTEVLTLVNGGKVGIGTINPDSKLTVKGGIHAEEVLIDTSVPTPDYVFENDYNLLPLSELEAYIKSNKHLPEVPSAEQLKADGLNVEKMNMLLLKKVEELTLHLIEQSKDIEKLKSDNAELKKALKK